MANLPVAASTLLDYWFADACSSQVAARQRLDLWFGHHPAFDAALHERYAGWPARALAGEFDHWRDSARGTLALLIVLDQLPRNLHRGTPLAYACDSAACTLALTAVEADLPAQMQAIEVPFFYLPFEHAEDLDTQHRCIAGYERERARAPVDHTWIFDACLQAAHDHCELIARFGRFPHRNAILGRVSSAEELDYLASGGRHWHQQAAGDRSG